MKKVFVSISAGMLLMSFALTAVATWSTDAAHSRLGFSITHMGIADVNGQFNKFDVNVSSLNGDFTGASIEMTAETSSINTGLEMRDNHLKTADFFDAEKYPTISFKSKEVKKGKGKNMYVVTGDLTMHGVTKPVTFTAAHTGSAKNQAGNDVAGFKMTGTLKRSDFGIAPEAGYLSDEVKMTTDLEVAKN